MHAPGSLRIFLAAEHLGFTSDRSVVKSWARRQHFEPVLLQPLEITVCHEPLESVQPVQPVQLYEVEPFWRWRRAREVS